VAETPGRLLVVRQANADAAKDGSATPTTDAEPVIVTNLADASERLRRERFGGVLVEPSAFGALTRAASADGRPPSLSKLDALYRAGLELAALDPAALASLSSEERINLLKANILKYARDLLHYDVVDIRLMNPTSGFLEPLVCEGIVPEVARLKLRPLATGNGMSGLVAATGRSYYCPDTSVDPYFIEGAPGSKSALTVPIFDQQSLIGVLSIESPKADAFTEQDREYLEMFGREIGAALHTLKLLSAERRGVADQSVELMNREVAMPVDAILNAATAVLDRYIGLDPEMAERLQQIMTHARSIRRAIHKVGEAIAPTGSDEPAPEQRRQPFRGLRVLVVDQDERVRRSAHSILGRLGGEVETAHNGMEALAMAKLSRYDFVLSDINLPDMTGYDMFRKLRELNPNQSVVLMSGFGYDVSHSIVRARQEGLQGVLYKPFRIDQLLDVLEQRNRPAPAPVPAA
jgi:CheY-like chemotaxis protein